MISLVITRITPEVTFGVYVVEAFYSVFTKQGLARTERHFMKFKSLLICSAYMDARPPDEATVWGICQVGLISPCNSDIYFVRRGSSPRYTLT